jgi:Protein of unknown function (DUF1059)
VHKALHCNCGFDAQAADEDGLVAEVRRHALEAHRMVLSYNDALLLAFRATLDDLTTAPRETTTTDEDAR